MTPAERFHAHLDVCVRCSTTPFDLCAEGSVLLHLAAREPRLSREERGSRNGEHRRKEEK